MKKKTITDIQINNLQNMKHELQMMEDEVKMRQYLTREQEIAVGKHLSSIWIILDDKVNELKKSVA